MASGDTLLVLLPLQAEQIAGNYPTFDLRNLHPVLDFDGTTNETTYWTAVMPAHYGGGGLSLRLFWTCDGTSGAVDWDAAWERLAEGAQDIDSSGFASYTSANGNAVPATSGLVAVTEIAFADGAPIDGIVAGDLFRLRVVRDAVNDTNATDVNLLAAEIRES